MRSQSDKEKELERFELRAAEVLESYEEDFKIKEIKFFGSLPWATPLISKIFGPDKALKWSDNVDSFLKIKRSAFKFVMVAVLRD